MTWIPRDPYLYLAIAVLSLTAAYSQFGDRSTDIRMLAEAGDANAQYSLGMKHLGGRGVPQDFAEALRWIRLAADQGHVEAQRNLGGGVPRRALRPPAGLC